MIGAPTAVSHIAVVQPDITNIVLARRVHEERPLHPGDHVHHDIASAEPGLNLIIEGVQRLRITGIGAHRQDPNTRRLDFRHYRGNGILVDVARRDGDPDP
jgi:hypothetical protein